jgi:hypothetical protein
MLQVKRNIGRGLSEDDDVLLNGVSKAHLVKDVCVSPGCVGHHDLGLAYPAPDLIDDDACRVNVVGPFARQAIVQNSSFSNCPEHRVQVRSKRHENEAQLSVYGWTFSSNLHGLSAG